MDKQEIKEYHPLALAFVGDAVQSLFVREFLIKESKAKTGKLHISASGIVSAKNQSKAFKLLEADLTEDEKNIARRTRNCEYNTKAKNASVEEYHNASCLEAVIGYNYLLNNTERLNEILYFSSKKFN